MKTTEQEGFDLPSWRFRISRLGPVESGEIEVKPLTLLCGPNNTGKTWVMYALYGFIRQPGLIDSTDLPGLKTIVNQLHESNACIWDFNTWLKSNAKEFIDVINRDAQERLPKIFNTNDEKFHSAGFEWLIDANQLIDYSRRYGFNITDYITPLDNGHIKIEDTNGDPLAGQLFTTMLSWHLLGWPTLRTVFLMPAERNGLHLFFRELTERRASLLHPNTRGAVLSGLLGDVSSVSFASYAEPIADYIDWLNRLRLLSKKKTSLFDAAIDRINKLTGGQYQIDTEANIFFTAQAIKNDAKPLDLHLTSSTVKSLFGLWFYLEHQAKPGDVLMIDEPELNLHPANQRAVARLLARLVNAGIRVVCSTHSDYFVREINSLLMLSRPHPKRGDLMKKFGYDEEEILKPEQVGAYVFDKGRIDAMPITEDEGIIAKTFDEQIHDLNETSDDIYYTYRGDYDEGEA